jgi:hypothetical protein
MGKLFNRDLPTANAFDPILSRMKASGDGANSGIACNFRHDHRVSSARQIEFDDPALPPGSTATDLNRLVLRYYETKVQQPEGPDTAFLRDSNKANWVYGAAEVPPAIPGHKDLVSCLDLTRLHEVWKAARDNYRLPYFCGGRDLYPANEMEDSKEVELWHERRIPPGDAAQVTKHMSELLAALAKHVNEKNFHHPVWATFWDDYKPLISANANTWLSLVGVGRCFSPRRWLALLRYPVRDAGCLVRPTVLDAGWNPIHFPSPPNAVVRNGGHPINLTPANSAPLIPEFIHVQFPFELRHWEATKTPEWEDWGGMIARTEDLLPPKQMVRFCRGVHHEQLVRHRAAGYGREVTDWMPDPY